MIFDELTVRVQALPAVDTIRRKIVLLFLGALMVSIWVALKTEVVQNY
jgi:hypothetical protein